MNETTDRIASATAKAARELAQLQRQAEQARAELTRLRRDLEEAKGRLDGSHAAQLLEANEQLLLAALRAQTDAEAAADTAARTLDEVSRSAELDA
ncbi:MAG TPA: hypothetical protein VF319_15345, partial [Caldimonas sp.]